MNSMRVTASSFTLLALVFVSVILVTGCSILAPRAAPAHSNITELAAQAKGEAIAVGTLASLGSFEYDIAAIKTHDKVVYLHAAYLYKVHEITKDVGQKYLDAADKALDLLHQAEKMCNQGSNGHCQGNDSKARALADQAKTVLAPIPF